MKENVVWVLGARGFVGRHVARTASRQGWTVFGLGHGQWLEEDYRPWGLSGWINGDVSESNLDLLARQSGLPGTVFHCAGGSSVGASIQAPLEDFLRSVGSTAHLLDWIRQRNPQCTFTLISSAAVYGGGHDGGISEGSPTMPASPYGHHKLAAEMLARSYQQSYGVSVAIVRLFSLYGEELRKQLIWDICHKLKAGPGRLLLGGSGGEIRDFIHVDDAAAFVLRVANELRKESGGILTVNCGTGEGRSIRSIADELISAWKSGAKVEFTGDSRLGDPSSLVADVDLARSLGLAVRVPFATGVRAYVRWFHQNQRSA
jgi:UDP-glucose 4-epimerase